MGRKYQKFFFRLCTPKGITNSSLFFFNNNCNILKVSVANLYQTSVNKSRPLDLNKLDQLSKKSKYHEKLSPKCLTIYLLFRVLKALLATEKIKFVGKT